MHPVRTLILVWLLLWLAACGGDRPRQFPALPNGASVLVIGDSLVAGTGASPGQSWPDVLARRSGWSVINAGVPGDTSADAASRLPALLDRHLPAAVIIAVGGNDFLRNMPLETTRHNITAMIAASLAVTQHVAVVAIPAKSLGAALTGRLSDHELFERIATQHGLALVAEAVSEALARENLRADRIHANAEGYAHIGARVAAALAAHGWLRP